MKNKQSSGTQSSKKYCILLLTNRDSDNVGDQVIEACDIALLKTAMKNLSLAETEYEIISRAASIVSKKYVKTQDKALLQTLERLVKRADMIVFGGAPLFNYQYQIFYERTAVTLEMAQKYQKPVIFSAIGIEEYDENNSKCQRLKKTLNFDCVKQITTRDGIEELKKYKANDTMVTELVSDPAVFTANVFRKFIVNKKKEKKMVGIFVLRDNGFVDSKINFTKENAAKLWKDLIREFEQKGYDYTLLTSGHFRDEAFLDYMIREHGIREQKCVFNMNAPEKLIKKISSFDAVVSCRLHPSIISFSLDVPSVGLVWNPKVSRFYECIGYPERRIHVDGVQAKDIVAKVEESIAQGIKKEEDYLITVYQYLLSGIQGALGLDKEIQPYSYEKLVQAIPAYPGTNKKEQEKKLKRKFRRIYSVLNEPATEKPHHFMDWFRLKR